jgi:hypothetical protein
MDMEVEAPPDIQLPGGQLNAELLAPRAGLPQGPQRPTATYQEPKLSKARVVAGVLASLLSPAAGQYLLRSPYDRAERRFEADLHSQQAYDKRAEFGHRQAQYWAGEPGRTAQTDYYRRRAAQPYTLDEQLGAAVAGDDEPKVEKIVGIKQRLQPPDRSVGMYEDFRSDDPQRQRTAREFLHLQGQERAEHRAGPSDKPRRGTPAQFASAEARKNTALRKLERDYRWDPAQRSYLDRDYNPVSPDKVRSEKQAIQDAYEAEVEALGGAAEHYDYSLDDATAQQLFKKAQESAKNAEGDVDQGRVVETYNQLKERETKRQASGQLPPQARARLKEGQETQFGNGQVWTLVNGNPVRVR